jgi:putative toxin-antitoxin system antitoxin component (TIGR02293 family)
MNTVDVEASTFLQWTPGGMRRGEHPTLSPAGKRRPAYGGSLGLSNRSGQEVVEALRRGLPVAAFEQLRDALDVSTRALAATTNIAVRTLARRKGEGRLRKDESERILRIGALFDRATEVLEGREAARQWLKSPKRALGGRTPLEYADTEPGAREVENLLIRLDYGVFS